MYLLQWKTNFLIHLCVEGRNLRQTKEHQSLWKPFVTSFRKTYFDCKNLVFPEDNWYRKYLRTQIFRFKYLVFWFENYFSNSKTKFFKYWIRKLSFSIEIPTLRKKVSKYGVFSSPYFPVFSPNAGSTNPEWR